MGAKSGDSLDDRPPPRPFGRRSHVVVTASGVADEKPRSSVQLMRAWTIQTSDYERILGAEGGRRDDARWRMFLEDGVLNQTVSGPYDSLLALAHARLMDELYVYSASEGDYLLHVPERDQIGSAASAERQRCQWHPLSHLHSQASDSEQLLDVESAAAPASRAWLTRLSDERASFADIDFEESPPTAELWRLLMCRDTRRDTVLGPFDLLEELTVACGVAESYKWSVEECAFSRLLVGDARS